MFFMKESQYSGAPWECSFVCEISSKLHMAHFLGNSVFIIECVNKRRSCRKWTDLCYIPEIREECPESCDACRKSLTSISLIVCFK